MLQYKSVPSEHEVTSSPFNPDPNPHPDPHPNPNPNPNPNPDSLCPESARLHLPRTASLPIRGFKTIREQDVAAVGVVDTQSVDRLGAAGGYTD
eukprot:scaffold31537_cov61-Phaeocystis_antarctica.AAC.2